LTYIIINDNAINNDNVKDWKQMPSSTADLILHPIRLRIIQAVVGRSLTPKEIGSALSDVPQATLYRHVNKLADAGILHVVEERPVRGTVERVYALAEGAADLGGRDLADVSKDEHMRYFATFVSTLLNDFGRYLETSDLDFEADGVGYRQAPLYLSDEEFAKLIATLTREIEPLLAQGPAPGRRRRILSTVVIPEPRNEEQTQLRGGQ